MTARRVIENTDKFSRPADKLVYVVLSMYAKNEKMTSYPSHERIAELCGCSVRTVQKSLRTLEKVGAIKTEARHDVRGYRTSNFYYLLELPDDF
ncbi:helix-turn-helix domain-containing protein [Salibacterium aidingense]|uniref:helix-turn-helix domain-containing protein n=1 Tax=Salibacterium aidingense TaxID=384933 RepID=UPI003BEE9178